MRSVRFRSGGGKDREGYKTEREKRMTDFRPIERVRSLEGENANLGGRSESRTMEDSLESERQRH